MAGHARFLATGAAVLFGLSAGDVTVTPGDLYQVIAERLNLRAGPSDDTNVRGQLDQGEELLELRRDGNWFGVRVLRTGQEGWVYGELIEQIASTGLDSGAVAPAPVDTGFLNLSEDFDRVLGELQERLGYAIASDEPVIDGNTLTVPASPEWLRAASRDSHVFATAAIYQMFKNYRDGSPVRVVLATPEGTPYVTIDDSDPDARLTIAALGEG